MELEFKNENKGFQPVKLTITFNKLIELESLLTFVGVMIPNESDEIRISEEENGTKYYYEEFKETPERKLLGVLREILSNSKAND